MKTRGVILDIEKFSDTYINNIPKKQECALRGRNWLPIKKDSKFAAECAYLIGKSMGDGHLPERFIPTFAGQKKEIENLRIIISRAFRLDMQKFSIRFKESLGTCFVLSVNDAMLGRILYSLGAPKGNKTKQPFLVPQWIIESKKCSKMFLKGILEDELSTIKIEKNTYSIKPKLKMAKEEKLADNLRKFLNQIKYLIEIFNVKCSPVSAKLACKKGQKTKELYFCINRNKENIIRFCRNIGFRANKDKINHLRKTHEVLEKTRYNRKPFIDSKRIISLHKKGLTVREIGKIVNLNKTSVHRTIVKKKNAREGIRTPESTKEQDIL